MKVAVCLYPSCSLQEITSLTASLALFVGAEIEYIAARKELYNSEEGLTFLPSAQFSEVHPNDYDTILLTGTMETLKSLYDEDFLAFLQAIHPQQTVVGAISSSPLFLAKAGLLKGKRYTGGLYMEMVAHFDFFEQENFCHQPLVCDGNVITALGFAYQDFAIAVLKALEVPHPERFFARKSVYEKKELTFYLGEKPWQDMLKEIARYEELKIKTS
ncbi:DJ-1/PfpI family protein [Streptococcus himalayensis]|uniref:4-methyl-5(B-hydroxyethyl)-thiazole monophosphate biosynthesis protein n=1 Tax=Streptococcus himalayensis TaxID=1888195 RepID=A0A917EG54_9STRE|nr:DJ-1/PfpI family protein [Streptococcus himalayensis]GGE29761.1 4-methyl-5(B-hydroxyethyl)-thiazole monophosphate biosynthesis protein [Streptococcus himalayensis]